MNIKFEITDIPAGTRNSGKYSWIVDALLALPAGKALKVPINTFRCAEAALSMKRQCGRACRQKTTHDGIYLWLEPVIEAPRA